MTRKLTVNKNGSSVYVDLTDEETTEHEKKEADFLTNKPLKNWAKELSDAGLSDDLENVISALDAPTRARMPAKTLDKYKTKQEIRLTKPAV